MVLFFDNSLPIGCSIFAGIGALILWLFIRRKRIEHELDGFYQKYGIYKADDVPANVLAALGEPDWSCAKGTLPNGKVFYWWQRFTTSTMITTNGAQTAINAMLAISLPPGAAGRRFMDRAEHLQTDGSWLKDLFVLNTDKPYKLEHLDDGSVLIAWHTVNTAKILEKKIEWLKKSVN